MFHHLAVYYRAGWIKYKHNKCIDSISYNDSIDTITYEWMWYDHDYMENIWRNLSDMLRNEQYTWKVNSFLFSTNWNVMLLANNQSLQWCHNERDGVSYHQLHDYLLDRLFRCRSRKTLKLCVTGLCVGNSPVTGEFPAQRASNAEKCFHLMTSSCNIITESVFGLHESYVKVVTITNA